MSPPVFITALLIFVGLPVGTVLYMAHRFFRFREKKLEVEAGMAAEKAAQYAAAYTRARATPAGSRADRYRRRRADRSPN